MAIKQKNTVEEAQAAIPERLQPIVSMVPFDAAFFSEVLPERVKQQCEGQPDKLPVVTLQLGDGRVFDVCHIGHFAPVWMAVFYYRDTITCQEMDLVFIPYALVTTATVSLHHKANRPAGFDVSKVGTDLVIGPTRQLIAKEPGAHASGLAKEAQPGGRTALSQESAR